MPSACALDRVLSCPTLPTLPAVGVQVLELARDPDVTVAKLARLVQSDPSLSARVLRTVNSSFFGLPQAVSKIDRALALLGLNTIKSLVLGFTLVEGTRGVPGDRGLDLTRHWRQALYAAAAARHVAQATSMCDPDEAFTAAMLQDIGMFACIVAIPDEYAPVIGAASHEPLPAAERSALGFDHGHVGSALARKWRLPEHLAAAIAHHHDPEAAPEALRPLARSTWIGMLIAESLGLESPANAEARFLITASQVLRLDPDALSPVLERIAEGADALAKAFDREVGAVPDIPSILAQASDMLVQAQHAADVQASALAEANRALTVRATTDALTGALNRAALEAEGPAAVADCRSRGVPVSAVFIDADRFKSINDTHGHPAGDAVLAELARRVRAAASGAARVYRYGGEEFAILLPGVPRPAAVELAEKVRACVEASPFDLSRAGGPAAHRVTISAGVAGFEPADLPAEGLAALLKAADEGVYQSKQGGRNRVSCVQGVPAAGAPTAAPGTGGGGVILLVEDDPLSARLLLTAVQKATGASVTWVTTGADAARFLRANPATGLVICDLHVGAEAPLELLCGLAASATRARVHAVSSDSGAQVEAQCLLAGAAAFTSKHRISADLPAWCREIAKALTRAA